jgi:2-oxoglutarate ferredoxin oxidoreductase subunit alpha
VPVIAASSPSDCFKYAFEASKIAMEHMTPVVLLTDGFIANSSEAWAIPQMSDMPTITPPIAVAAEGDFMPYKRNEQYVRSWAFPGTAGLEHRIGGLEKHMTTGNISYDPANHAQMVATRAAKVAAVVNDIPQQSVDGDNCGELLVVGWGGTRGHLNSAVEQLRGQGKSVSHCHLNYINPLPSNMAQIFENFKRIVVCELNEGQAASYLQGLFPQFRFERYNKVEGQPFTVEELVDVFNEKLR